MFDSVLNFIGTPSEFTASPVGGVAYSTAYAGGLPGGVARFDPASEPVLTDH